MATIVLTGGGTGGHVIPALALLTELKKKFDKIVFIGGKGIEEQLAKESGLPFYSVDTVKFDRTHFFSNVKIPSVLRKGINECEKILKEVGADVVFSKGGYVALPACFAAKKLGVPVVCHESDYTMGLANKVTSRFAAKVLTSFSDTKGGICVGNPVREEIANGSKIRAKTKYSIDNDKKTILFCGGSQGATAINQAVYASLDALKKYNVIHLSGKSGDFSLPDTPSYRQIAFSDDMPDLLALADVVVCRAGANTLFEVAAVGKPALCIPLPKGNSRGDQLLNAAHFAQNGYALILPQEKLTSENLLIKIEETLHLHPPKLDVSMTNKKIVNEVFSVIK